MGRGKHSIYSHDIIVIGGGAAGLSVTSACAQLGMKTALVEREHMGGDCLYFGCIPSKTLLHIARTFECAAEVSRFSRGSVFRPRVRMPAVNDHIATVIRRIADHDSPERFTSLGADVYLGPARFRSPHEVVVNDEVLSSGRIIIATGSSAAVPPIPGLEAAGYLTNRDMFSLKSLPKSLVVIGGGPVGVELAQAYARLGSEVTIVEMAPRLLPRDDAELAEIVTTRLSREGIRAFTGARVVEVERGGRQKRVVIDVDDTRTELRCHEILIAAGRQGNTDALGLEAAGLKSDASGFIPANKRLESAVRHISVIGDANGTLPFTHVAGAEAATVVRRVALRAGGNMNYRATPWVTYTDPELANVGHTEASALAEGITFRVVRQPFTDVDRAHAEENTDGLLKIIVNRRGRVIGAGIAGNGAGELIGLAAHAVTNAWKLSKLRSAVLPYPTMAEAYSKVASNDLAPKLFNARIRGILRRVLGYRGTGPRARAEQ